MSGKPNSQKLVLVVEDRPSVASVYRTHLEASGYACELACSHEAAAELAARSAPFAILLSLELPGAGRTDLIAPLGAAAGLCAAQGRTESLPR